MIPDNFGVKLDLEPVEVQLSLNTPTMLFLAGLSFMALIYGVRRIKR